MGELTRELPKPLLKTGGYPLIDYTLCNLHRWGIRDVYINLHYHGRQIAEYIKKFDMFDFTCCPEEEILGTAGGIKTCIGDATDDELFLVVNPDLLHFPDSGFRPPGDMSGDILLYLAEKKPEDSYTTLDFSEGKVYFRTGGYYYIGLAVVRWKTLTDVIYGKYHDLADIFRDEGKKGTLRGALFPGTCIDVGDYDRYMEFRDMDTGKYPETARWLAEFSR